MDMIQMGDFTRFLNITVGACNELESQILLAKDLNYIKKDNAKLVLENCIEVRKVIIGLKNKIKK